MNRICFFSLLLVVILFAGCQDRQIQASLNTAEECLQDHPDSALQILRRLPDERLSSSSQKARRALLLSMALDKSYIDVTDDSIARMAVQYYSPRKDRRRAMLSWYSLGRVQMNAGNPGGAIISFKQAEAKALEIEDQHYLGLIYRNIGDLYGGQDDAKEALDYFSRSATCFQQTGEPLYMVYSQYPMALAFYSLNNKSACDSLLHSIEKYAKDSSNDYLLSQVDLAKGSIALLSNHENATYAKTMIHSGIARKRSATCQDISYLMLASAYMGQRDSSDLYRALSLQRARTYRDTGLVYSAIYKVESYMGHYKEALRYQDLSMSIANRRMSLRESMVISNSLADYHKSAAMQAEEQIRKERITAVLSAVVLLLLILFLVQRLKLRLLQNREKDRIIADQENRLSEDIERTGEILSEIKSLQREKSEVLSSLAASVLSQMELVNKWANTYNTLLNESDDPYRKLDADYYQQKRFAVQEFYASLDPIRKNDNWYAEVESWVDQYKDEIMARARRACYQPERSRRVMSESDFRTLLLMFTGLPDKTIAYFLGLTYGNVRMRRSRYKDLFSKMDSPDGPILFEALVASRLR